MYKYNWNFKKIKIEDNTIKTIQLSISQLSVKKYTEEDNWLNGDTGTTSVQR